MRNNVYRFQPDKPTVIRLKYRNGKPFQMGEVSGFTYTLDTGLTCRVPVEVSKEIDGLHLDIGQPFQVTKRTLTSNEFAWDIERVEEVKPDGPRQGNRPELSVKSPNRSSIEHHDTTELPPAILTAEHGRTILRQLIGMVEIVVATENYSKRIGRPIHFSPQDIRSLAISCFIQQSHEAIERDRLEAVRVA